MGDYVTIIFLLILGFSGFFVFQRFKALDKKIRNLEAESREAEAQFSGLKTKLNQTEKKLSEKTDAFIKLRAQHKKAKSRIHNASAKRGGAAGSGANKDSETMIALAKSRSDLVKAQAEAANLRGEIKELNKALRAERSKESAEKELPEEAADSSGDLKKALSNRTKADKIRMASIKRDHLNEVENLKRRLNRALRDRDTQRRRGDNNEKAYNITKNQLESALDRLHQFDPSIPRPFVLPPEVAKKLREKEEAELREKAESDAAAVADPESDEGENVPSKDDKKSKKVGKTKKSRPKKGIVQAKEKPEPPGEEPVESAEEKPEPPGEEPPAAEEKPEQSEEEPPAAEEAVLESTEQEPAETDTTAST